jgi:hypothetical protein
VRRCARLSFDAPAPKNDFLRQPDMTCSPALTFMANSTLETYSQGDVPQASSSWQLQGLVLGLFSPRSRAEWDFNPPDALAVRHSMWKLLLRRKFDRAYIVSISTR